MNFFVRGFLSIKERIGKTALLFLVITTVSVFVLAGFSIKSATENASILARQKLGATISLSQNMDKMREEMRSSRESGKEPDFKITKTSVKKSDVDKILTLDNITDYNILNNTEANSSLAPIESSTTEEFTKDMGSMRRDMPKMVSGDFTLQGVRMMTEEDGSIVSGRAINSDDAGKNVVVIEETLAEKNDIKVSDKIKIKDVNDEKSKEVEVVGIYKSSSELNDNAMRNNAMNPYNKIYSSYTFVNTIKGADSGDIDRSEFYVNDPVNVDSVLENAKKLDIDFDTFKLDANNGEYEKMMGPIENVGSFANSTVVIVSIAGAIILGLIIMLWIKDRKNEIGILLSLGESKFKIISQFAVEVLIILVLSLGVAGIIGNAVSSKLGEVLVQKEISSLSENNKTNDYMMGPNGMGGDFKGDRNNQNVETIDKLDVNVSISDLSKMVGISLMISFLAIAIPSIGIMRLEPKEILSKHN